MQVQDCSVPLLWPNDTVKILLRTCRVHPTSQQQDTSIPRPILLEGVGRGLECLKELVQELSRKKAIRVELKWKPYLLNTTHAFNKTVWRCLLHKYTSTELAWLIWSVRKQRKWTKAFAPKTLVRKSESIRREPALPETSFLFPSFLPSSFFFF